MIIEIHGDRITCELDFHVQLAKALGVQGVYGNNLDALWDLLGASVERPVKLVWKDSKKSEKSLGEAFQRIVTLLERVRLQDEHYRWVDKFTYDLA